MSKKVKQYSAALFGRVRMWLARLAEAQCWVKLDQCEVLK